VWYRLRLELNKHNLTLSVTRYVTNMWTKQHLSFLSLLSYFILWTVCCLFLLYCGVYICIRSPRLPISKRSPSPKKVWSIQLGWSATQLSRFTRTLARIVVPVPPHTHEFFGMRLSPSFGFRKLVPRTKQLESWYYIANRFGFLLSSQLLAV
jgi:hypothetical protein